MCSAVVVLLLITKMTNYTILTHLMTIKPYWLKPSVSQASQLHMSLECGTNYPQNCKPYNIMRTDLAARKVNETLNLDKNHKHTGHYTSAKTESTQAALGHTGVEVSTNSLRARISHAADSGPRIRRL
jgi:hypothetical protein